MPGPVLKRTQQHYQIHFTKEDVQQALAMKFGLRLPVEFDLLDAEERPSYCADDTLVIVAWDTFDGPFEEVEK